MSNRVNLTLDVTKTGIQNPLIKVRQGDGGFETLRTTVTSNGEPLDLQGWIITFMGTTAGNHKIVDGNVTLVEAPNGIFDYTPSKAWGMDIGEFKIAYFKFVNGDGSASSANFRVNVIGAVDLTQEEAQNYISVVDTTIAEINQHLTDSLANVTKSIADANNNANTVASNVNALGKRVDDYNNKLAAVKVGGRNLLLDTGRSFTGVGSNSDNGDFNAHGGQYYLAGGKTVADLYKQYGPSQYLTLSFDWEASGDNISGQFNPQWNGTPWLGVGTSGDIKPSNTNKSGHYTKTVQLNSGGYSTGEAKSIMIRQDSLTGTIIIKNMKLEAGNVATDWTPAPEDAPSNDAQLVHKTGTETIAGDKTFTSPIDGQLSGNAATATRWQTARTLALTGDVTGSVSFDGSDNVSIATTGANLVHKTGVETIEGDKAFNGVSTLTNVKSSNIKTGSVTLNGLTINFRQTVVGVNVFMDGLFQGDFGTSNAYITTSNGVPSTIDKPRQNVVLNIIGNGGVGGTTTNSPFKLEVLIGTDGTIKYRAKNLRENDTTSRNSTIVGAASTFYSLD